MLSEVHPSSLYNWEVGVLFIVFVIILAALFCARSSLRASVVCDESVNYYTSSMSSDKITKLLIKEKAGTRGLRSGSLAMAENGNF